MKKLLILPLMFLLLGVARAESPIYKQEVAAPLQAVYQSLYAALEQQKLWVVFEADMGRSINGMAQRLGERHNQNGLQGIRSMVVCNPWYANEVSNLDPDMLALCPLRVALTHKAGTTSMLFARPSVQAQGSAALPVIVEVEQLVIDAIKAAAAAQTQ